MPDNRGKTEWIKLVKFMREQIVKSGEAKGAEATKLAMQKAKPIWQKRKARRRLEEQSKQNVF